MVKIDGNQLTIPEVVAVARHGEQVALDSLAQERMVQSNQWVREIASGQAPVYGINTGFGIFADRRISPHDSAHLSRNLILSSRDRYRP